MPGKSEARPDTCPDDELLVAFSLGDLPEADLDSIRAHQESCPNCEARARSLEDRTDAVIDGLRLSVLGPADNDGGSHRDRSTHWPREPEGPAESGCPAIPDYEILGPPLGAGSMGVVYKARHLKLGRIVALKMIARRSRKVSELFQIEAKAVAQLQHPNIVQIFEIGEHEGKPFLALEFVEGGSLEREIADGPLPPRRAAELLRALALAADHAHRQGIVHCDLKPSNIPITPEGIPKIADFGVAKWLESGDHWGREGSVMGTPRYMAPEQASGSVRSVGPATDIYSLGVILYEMLTGRTPHQSAAPTEIFDHIRNREPAPPRELQPKVPRDLEAIALKCLRKDPARRYADAKALANDLGRFLAGEPIADRPAGRARRAYLWARRHPAISGGLLITSLWLVIGGAVYRQYNEQIRRYESDLKNATIDEPKASNGNRPILATQAADGSINLWAFAAAIYGKTLALESHFGNIGYWHGADERAVWTFRVDQPATFSLTVEYANANDKFDNAYLIHIGDIILRNQTIKTGAWSQFRSFPAGTVTLPAGIHRLEVLPATPLRGALFDLRSVTLTPQ